MRCVLNKTNVHNFYGDSKNKHDKKVQKVNEINFGFSVTICNESPIKKIVLFLPYPPVTTVTGGTHIFVKLPSLQPIYNLQQNKTTNQNGRVHKWNKEGCFGKLFVSLT
jgi:hypothetical protein